MEGGEEEGVVEEEELEETDAYCGMVERLAREMGLDETNAGADRVEDDVETEEEEDMETEDPPDTEGTQTETPTPPRVPATPLPVATPLPTPRRPTVARPKPRRVARPLPLN